ncbi:unnamed protein product, partial [Rotaria sp. Silwood2]
LCSTFHCITHCVERLNSAHIVFHVHCKKEA